MAKGLSVEEKRTRLLELFHETRDFYQLKELEKLAPKSKGIVSQSVKEILQGLVDDGLVQTDKIGACNIFWSFPSQHGALLQHQLKEQNEVKTEYAKQQQELDEHVNTEKENRVETETRKAKLEQLASLKKQHVALENELQAWSACDPVQLDAKRRAGVLAKEAAERWTENFSSLFRNCTDRGMDGTQLRAMLELEDTFEDL
ncbi:Meiotic nuclear division protein 1 [Mycena kentingensis (nom. inval.)]|nr:Meiotic nuclear division protein 1 [Mycena kentingensis (nom. inval.)]